MPRQGWQSSIEGSEHRAIGDVIAEASRTLCHLDRCELVQTSGHLVAGTWTRFQVHLKIGFRLEFRSGTG